MKTLKISGIALLLAALPAAALAGESPAPAPGGMPGGMNMPHPGGMHMGGGMNMPRPGGMNMGGVMNMPRPGGQEMGGPRNWGGRQNGRWAGGWQAPGGWNAYRRPSVGYMLPSYWVNPSYYIGNYWNYGLSRPAYGYGWSRYYDDAVLTDRYGRVYDSARVDWDRYDRYDDGGYNAGYDDRYAEDYSDSYGYRDNGYRNDGRANRNTGNAVAGALIGGIGGAFIGDAVAAPGSRVAGALIGGGLGALAGTVIGGAIGHKDNRYGTAYRSNRVLHQPNRGRMDYDYDYGQQRDRDGVTYNGQWQGTWTGRWNGGPTQSWNGTYQGGTSRGRWSQPVAAYPYPAEQAYPYPAEQSYPEQQNYPPVRERGPVVVHQGGYYGNGYGGEEVTTVVVQPQPATTTTTTTTTEEIYYASVPRKRYAPRRVVYRPRPRYRVQCLCGS